MKSKGWLSIIFILLITTAFSQNKPYGNITVAQDGSGDFTTIQEAVNSTRDLGPGEVLISVKPGVYKEKLVIPSWKHQLTLRGSGKENTRITHADFSGKIDSLTQQKLNTFTSHTVLVQGNDIKIENLTIENASCNQGQAVALHVEGDRFVIKNSAIIGCQDTVYAATENSRQFYDNCEIEGTTDFIFGEATAVFKNCTVKSKANSFVTAAATPKDQQYGFVFINCKLIASAEIKKVYLGRPWRPYAKTVFLNCELGDHIVAEGWDAWKGDAMFPEKEKTTFYAEYQNSGPGSSAENRMRWSKQLSPQEAKEYTIKKILAGSDGWNPIKN